MPPWRLLRLPWPDYASYRISLNSAIGEAVAAGRSPPTLVLLRFLRSAVAASYYPSLDHDLSLPYFRSANIPVARFLGGAGIGFIDRGMVVSMAYAPAARLPGSHGELLSRALESVAEECNRRFGIASHYRAPNDIQVGDRKFALASATLEGGLVNLAVDLQVPPPDIESIRKGLPLPPEKLADKSARGHDDRVSCLEREAGRKIAPEEVEEVLLASLGRACGAAFEPGRVSEEEMEVSRARQESLGSDAFQMARTERVRFGPSPRGERREFRMKVPGGPFLRCVALREGPVLRDLLITGGIQCSPVEGVDRLEDALRGCRVEEVGARVGEFFRSGSVRVMGAGPETFTALIRGAAG
ncbi:MAG: hypothetical protein QXO51_02985 [Halobacteria archaeon]